MPDAKPVALTTLSPGLVDYQAGLELQQLLHQRVRASDGEQFLIFLQHHPVITLGKSADLRHLLLPPEVRRDGAVALVATDRGGQVTAHMPGQLVVYPVLGLAAWRLSPKTYVALLEQAVIDTLAEFGLAAGLDPEHPGVWVGSAKVCAIGVRFKDRVTMHGLALNCDNALDLFQAIVPCGIRERGVTSVSAMLRRPCSVADVQPSLERHLRRHLQERARIPEGTHPCNT